ncbi:carbohydrate porin [Vibrio parahaemolyticus]|nr:carbohydrate porin [Vibrio parahaemolyticus]
MKQLKVLPLAIAVASSLVAFGSTAAESATTNLEERIANIESRMASETNDLVFFGYARYGMHYKEGDSRYVSGIGSTGQTVGRLGNEANGGEFGLSKKINAENGAKWDITVMVEDWGNDEWSSPGGVNLKRFYAGASNIFEGQENMYVWAGRDFHARLQQGLNDYYVTIEDGQGGGFKNLDLGGANLDFAVVGGADFEEGSLGNDNGKYAITSRLHGIDMGMTTVDFYAHYGFASSDADTPTQKIEGESAYLVGTKASLWSGANLHLRYSDGASNSVLAVDGSEYTMFFASIEGGFSPADNWNIDYLGAFVTAEGDDTDDRNEISLITRPQYKWNDVHSTWLELGYAKVDNDDKDDVDGWKATLSQNISLGGLPWSRPMLRFYATVGEKDTGLDTVDTTSFGAMFEAWW